MSNNDNYITEELTLGTVLAAISIASTTSLIIYKIAKNSRDRIIVFKSLNNYEEKHKDIIKLSELDHKVYKLDKILNATPNKGAGKGEEDLGTLFTKLFKKKVNDTKANRIVEYFYKGKLVIAAAFTADRDEDNKVSDIDLIVSICDREFNKHKDYYITKIAYDRNVITKETEKFVTENYKK